MSCWERQTSKAYQGYILDPSDDRPGPRGPVPVIAIVGFNKKKGEYILKRYGSEEKCSWYPGQEENIHKISLSGGNSSGSILVCMNSGAGNCPPPFLC